MGNIRTVGFCLAFFFFACCAFTKPLELSKEESTWLEQNLSSLQLWFNPDFPPLEFSEHGQFVGMGADVIKLIEKRLGVTFQKTVCKDWNHHLASLENGDCAIAPTIVLTKEREHFARFTTPYTRVPVVIIGPASLGKDIQLSGLSGRKIAVVKGFATEGYLREKSKGRFDIRTVKNVEEGLRAVAFGQVDAYVENLAVASYFITKNGISNLHVAGKTDYEFAFRIAVSHKYPELVTLVQRALEDISDEELQSIIEDWISLHIDEGWSKETVRFLLLVGSFLVSLVICLGIISGILKRRLNEKVENLARSEKRFRTLFLHAPIPLIEVRGNDQKLRFNGSATRILGYTNDDVPDAEAWFRTAYPDQIYRIAVRDKWEGALKAAIAADGHVASEEISVCCKDGKEKIMLIGANVIDDTVVVSLIDIDESKKAAAELVRQKESLRATLDSIGDAVIATDRECKITMLNPVASVLTGWSIEEAVDQRLDKVFSLIDAKTREAVDKPCEAVLNEEVRLLTRDDKELRIDGRATPMCTETGEKIGTVLVFRDVTQKFLMEEKLRHMQKMEAVGQLAGGVAHDFNNMLCGIIGGAELLRDTIDERHEQRECLDMVLGAAKSAAELTRRLLKFSRKQTLEKNVLDVNTPIIEALSLFKRTIDPRIKLDVSLLDEKIEIFGDQSLLQNAVLNLLINAGHAMDDGGTITVNSRLLSLDEMAVKSTGFPIKAGQYVELEVRDTGCGIEQENLSRIFEPFFSTKELGKGTGLGLYTVFATVEQHHGAITAYSEAGSGTCFRILLPTSDMARLDDQDGETELIGGTGKILLVDDELAVREIAGRILTNLGYQVTLAVNGQEALETFNTEEGGFDLVILDMIMPQMNGRDCFNALRKVAPDLPVLLSSGFARDDDILAMEKNGLAGFIRKPFLSAELDRAVRRALLSSKET